jgi:GNAT superfamily N-acetyltransferase
MMRIVDLGISSPPELLAAWHRLNVAAALETLPGLETPTAAESRGELVSDIAARRRGVAALDGAGAMLGAITWEETLLEDEDLAYGWLFVDAGHRRRGVGSALLAATRERLLAAGRRRLNSSVLVGSPGEEFARQAGARATQIEVHNVLDLGAVDVETLRANAAAPSPYALRLWIDHCPDDLVAAFAHAHTAMDDAPRGDEPYDASAWSVERVRSQERGWAGLGHTTLTVAAVHEPTGEVAGYTQLLLTGRPTTAIQEDTGVVRAHRGHGLGRAVKSANLLQLKESRPAITNVVTWNAESNAYMLAVNDELGFRPHSRWHEVALAL